MTCRFQRRAIRALRILGCVSVLSLLAVTGAQAGKSYSYETDPIRLGQKALEEGKFGEARAHFQEALDNEYQVYKAYYGMADILRQEGSYSDAEAKYREALAAYVTEKGSTDFPECSAGLGLTLLRLGRNAEAEQEFQRALDEKGNLWEAQYGMARVLMEKGNFDEALKLLDKGKKKKDRSEGADMYDYGMALYLMGTNQLDEAEKEALKAVYMNPGDPEYLTLVAQIYTKKGDLPLAIQRFEEALAQPGARPTARTLHTLGKLYQDEMYQMYKEGNRSEQVRLGAEALRKYQESVRMDSLYAPAWKDMGALYALANKYDEAAGAYLRYAQLRSDDPEALLGLAEACMKGQTKRYKQALEAAQAAYALDSTSVDTRLVLARASFVNREKERAARLYSMVTDTLKFEPEDYVRMGQLKSDAGDLAGAAADLRKALDWDSTLAEGWYSLGLVELKQDQDEAALQDFLRSSRLDPNNPTVRLNTGITYLKLRRNLEAIAALRQAVRLVPDIALPRIYLASALMTADSTSAAMEQYVKAREMDPKNPGVLRGLGLGYLKRADYDHAIEVLEEATQVDPANADGWAWLGQAYALKNSFAKARAALQKALEINPTHATAKKLLDILDKQAAGGNQ